jgi:hypothetical protein
VEFLQQYAAGIRSAGGDGISATSPAIVPARPEVCAVPAGAAAAAENDSGPNCLPDRTPVLGPG